MIMKSLGMLMNGECISMIWKFYIITTLFPTWKKAEARLKFKPN